ncbi:MAG TPA: hypothetical protein VGA63_01655 [Geopsychrobacteraceae bacterium]|jgi:hypothetical protein
MKKTKRKPDSVFKEAWDNMSGDFSRLLPEKLRKRQGKKLYFILFGILELVLLGAAGKYLYDWLTG